MPHESLTTHYENKYEHEAVASGARLISPTSWPRNRFEACVSSLARALPQGAQVLELGAGDGTVPASLRAVRPDLSIIVSDATASRLQGLRRRFADDSTIEIRHMEAEHVDGVQVDAVIMVALIEHLIDPMRAMQRIGRALRPGGVAFVDTPNIAKWTRRLKLAAGRFPSTASRSEGLTTYDGRPVDLHDEGHLHYFTFGSLGRMLTQRCGFDSVAPVPYWIGPAPQAIGGRLAAWRPTLFSELAVLARVDGYGAADSE